MGILESKLDSESKNYINALCAIEFIARYTKDDHIIVAKYLLNTGFDQYVESYTKDTFYKFHLDEAIDNNSAYLKTFTILKTIIELNLFSYDEKLTLNSFNFHELGEFEDYYWRKDKFFSSPMIIDMNFNAAQLEEMQSEFKPNLGIAGFLERFTKNIGVDAPIHIVKMFNQDSYTIEEASLFIHANIDEQGIYLFDTKPNKHNVDLIADFIKSGRLAIEKNGAISKENLKTFLSSIDIVIKGFNEYFDGLESMKLSIKIEKLQIENEKLKNRISELECLLANVPSKTDTLENIEQKNINPDELKPEQEIPNTRTRGTVLKIIAILADMADLPDEPYTAFNMMEAHADSKGLKIPSKTPVADWLTKARDSN